MARRPDAEAPIELLEDDPAGPRPAEDGGAAWSRSWVRPLWRVWLSLLATIVGLSLALFGVFERTTLSATAWRALSRDRAYPISWIILAALATAFLTSAGFIVLLQIADYRRVREAQTKLTASERRLADLRAVRDDALGRLRDKSREFENLEGLFRDRERLRMLDHITGIPNFQSWEKDLRTWASLGRNEKEFSLILVDLDNLKWLNARSRDCADQVLRFFARRTYDSMRRDEQLYKAPELGSGPEPTAEMYRHYQGGDEFFFIISGDVYGAVGFVNRLAERIKSYSLTVDEEILANHLDAADTAAFELSFSAVIAAIHPGAEPATALPNAYAVLDRAKTSAVSRLLVVFDRSYDDPADHRGLLEAEQLRIDHRLSAGGAVSPVERAELEDASRSIAMNIALLKKAEQLFAPAARPPQAQAGAG